MMLKKLRNLLKKLWDENLLRTFKTCDAIYVQPDWEQSRGAKLEIAYAEKYGLEIIYE